MSSMLLEKQIALLQHFTSSAAIFDRNRAAYANSALVGFSGERLLLEARFSHKKRMAKIIGFFPRTVTILQDESTEFVRDFVDAFPATTTSRSANASEFFQFLRLHCRCKRTLPEFIVDVASCELASAQVHHGPPPSKASSRPIARGAVRRHRRAALLRCDYDVQPIFAMPSRRTVSKRDTFLGISLPASVQGPSVFEMSHLTFELLTALDDWTHPNAMVGIPHLQEILRELAASALIEVQP